MPELTPPQADKKRVVLSLGANLGNRADTLYRACTLIETHVGTIVAKSNLHETEPWGFESQNAFLNMVTIVETDLQPIDLLHVTQEIERKLGRTHKSENGHYTDRTIDIDIIDYAGIELKTAELTLPHPLAQERNFVMIPWQECILALRGES